MAIPANHYRLRRGKREPTGGSCPDLQQIRDCFQSPRVGSCLTLRSEASRRHTRWQSKRPYWGGAPGGEQEGEGAQESARQCGSGFMVMGSLSRSSLASRSDSGPFPVGSVSLSHDGSSQGDSGGEAERVPWCLIPPFALSRVLPVGGGLLVPRSFPGPPDPSHSCEGPGQAVSVSVSLTTSLEDFPHVLSSGLLPPEALEDPLFA